MGWTGCGMYGLNATDKSSSDLVDKRVSMCKINSSLPSLASTYLEFAKQARFVS